MLQVFVKCFTCDVIHIIKKFVSLCAKGEPGNRARARGMGGSVENSADLTHHLSFAVHNNYVYSYTLHYAVGLIQNTLLYM